MSRPDPASRCSQERQRDIATRFIRSSIVLVAIELLSKVLGLVFYAMLARYLGVRELGVYSFAVSIANFFSIVPRFGFESVAQRELGRRHVLHAGYFTEITVAKAVLTLVAMCCVWGVVTILGSGDLLVTMAAALFVMLFTYLDYVNSLFRGLMRAEQELAVRVCFSISNLAIGSAILYFGGGLMEVVSSQLACLLGSLAVALFILKQCVTGRRTDWKATNLGGHLRAGASFAGILTALYFSNQAGALLLPVLTDKTELGYYAAAMKLFDNLTLVAAAVMGSFLPTMSELHASSAAGFTHTLRFTTKYLFVLAAPISLGLVILAEPVSQFLYGDSFAPTSSDFRVLGLSLIFCFWNSMVHSALIAGGHEGLVFRLTCIGAGVHVAANLLLIPYLAHVGASWAVVVTQASYFILLYVHIHKYIGVSSLLRLIAGPSVCLAVMGLVIVGMAGMHFIVVVSTGAVTYVVTLLLTGSVRKSDLSVLQEAVRRKMAPRHE